jgi:hypothetical protein
VWGYETWLLLIEENTKINIEVPSAQYRLLVKKDRKKVNMEIAEK